MHLHFLENERRRFFRIEIHELKLSNTSLCCEVAVFYRWSNSFNKSLAQSHNRMKLCNLSKYEQKPNKIEKTLRVVRNASISFFFSFLLFYFLFVHFILWILCGSQKLRTLVYTGCTKSLIRVCEKKYHKFWLSVLFNNGFASGISFSSWAFAASSLSLFHLVSIFYLLCVCVCVFVWSLLRRT